MRFYPEKGVPKSTTQLVRDFMEVAAEGKPVPKELRQRVRDDEFLASKGIGLQVNRPGGLQPWRKVDEPTIKVDPSQITVRGPSGEIIEDWAKMSAAERRRMLRSEPVGRMRPPEAPAPAPPLALPAPGRKGTATRRVKAEVWREFRRLRPTLTPDAYRKASEAMRAVMVQYTDDSPEQVSDEQFKTAKQTVLSHFSKEMKKRHDDWGPDWGKRRSRRTL